MRQIFVFVFVLLFYAHLSEASILSKFSWGINAGASYTYGKRTQKVEGKDIVIKGKFTAPVVGIHAILPKNASRSGGGSGPSLRFTLRTFFELESTKTEPDDLKGVSAGKTYSGNFRYLSAISIGTLHIKKWYMGLGGGPAIDPDRGRMDIWGVFSTGIQFNARWFLDLRGHYGFKSNNRFKHFPIIAQLGVTF